MNNSVKGLPTTPTPGFCSMQSGIPVFSCTVRKRQRQIFKGVVVKTPNLLCEEMVILLKKLLEYHRFYQVSVCVLSHFSCVRLCGPMDCSLAGLSIHGILQVRILEWVGHSLLQGIFRTQGSNPSLLHCRDSLLSEPPGKPVCLLFIFPSHLFLRALDHYF